MASVGVIMYIAIAVVAVYGILRGLRKGLYKSLIDLGVTIVAIVLSVLIAKLLSKSLVDIETLISFLDKLVEASPSMTEVITPIRDSIADMSKDSNAIGLAMALPVVILAPFVYMIVYLVIASILKIPKLIVARSIFGKNSGETYHGGSRPAGAAVGAVARLVSFIAFVVPVVGYIMLANTVMTDIGEASLREIPSSITSAEVMSTEEGVIEEVAPENGATEQQTPTAGDRLKSLGDSCIQARDSFIAPLADGPAFKFIHAFGGKWLFNSLSSAKIVDTKVSLEDEISILSSVYYEATALIKTPTAEYGSVQTEAIDNITSILDEAKIAPSVISGALSYTSNAWLNGESAFGMSKIIVGEYYEPTLDKLLVMFSQTTDATIKEDIHTIGNMLNLCIEEQAFVEVANQTPVNIAKNEEFVGQLFVELYENNRTRPIAGDLINSFKNYLYRVYNDVNDTEIPYPTQLDINALSKEQVYEEGARMASIMGDFTKFYETVDLEETDNTKFLIQTDVRSLGKALDKVEQSLFLGDSYSFILSAVLRSEGAAQFAFMTPEFADAMINRTTSMESVLVSRQQIAIILSVTEKEDRDDAIKHILENVDKESAAVIKETLTSDVLGEFGMNDSQSESMSNTLNSVIDQIASNEGEYTEEQLEAEIAAVGSVVDVVKGATSDQEGSIFANDSSSSSKTDMTADQFVSNVVNSNILSSAVQNASKDEEGNTIEDPYKISGGMSAEDKESAKLAIEEYYANNQADGADNAELKDTLGSLANIFGVDVNLD